MRLRTKIGALTVAIVATVTGVLLASSGSSPAGAALLTVTTPQLAYSVPSFNIDVAPLTDPAKQSAQATTAVKSLCAQPVQNGAGCYSSTPDAVQYVSFTDRSDSEHPIIGKPAYLLQWTLKGRACLLGLTGPPGTDLTAWDRSGVICTLSVAVDPATSLAFDSWSH